MSLPHSFQTVTPAESSPAVTPTWRIKLLYDSECPLCMREVRFLQRRDDGRGIVLFVDIADLSYDPALNANISYEQAMGKIHGILPDGTVLVNIQVFRYIYEQLGLGWVYAITRFKIFEKALNQLYTQWAKWRLPLTGRPPIEVITAERTTKIVQDQQKRCRLMEEGEPANSLKM